MRRYDQREHWDQEAAVYASGAGRRRFGRFLDLYEESCWHYIKPTLRSVDEATILEAGCGVGRWVLRLAPLGYKMVMSDISPEMIRQARQRIEEAGLDDHVWAYHVLDICNMAPLSDESFDLVLALGGPLSLCRDARTAVAELYRITKPRGYVICDGANRFRTALELVHAGETDQLRRVLSTGDFSRPDGLTDHRFAPQEIVDLFETEGMTVVHVAGVCPLFDYLPTEKQVSVLHDDSVFDAMLMLGRHYAEDPYVVGLSGRLLTVAHRGA